MVGINSGGAGYAQLRLESNGTVMRCVFSKTNGAPTKVTARVRA
ncbi:hypothetical protein ABN078_12705 [Providencia huaxiensis]|nr:hypothetical protein [Providencia sp. PROV032]